MVEDTQSQEGAFTPERRNQITSRMKECELALSEAKRELRSINSMRFKALARIEEIEHDIDFLTEQMAFADLVEPYDFSKPIDGDDYSENLDAVVSNDLDEDESND